MAMLFLQNADKARYGKKYDEIDKASELGRDEFPITLTAAFNVLVMKEHWGSGRGDSTGRGGQGGRVSNKNPETYANGRPQICPPDEEP
eukprot:1967624-Ditylum_brightwellii.AAC.1